MWIAGVVGVSLLAAFNAVVTRRVWRSAMYERAQRIGQTLLLWLLPGAAILVNWVLQGTPDKGRTLDPTANDGCADYGMVSKASTSIPMGRSGLGTDDRSWWAVQPAVAAAERHAGLREGGLVPRRRGLTPAAPRGSRGTLARNLGVRC